MHTEYHRVNKQYMYDKRAKKAEEAGEEQLEAMNSRRKRVEKGFVLDGGASIGLDDPTT